MNLVLEIVDAPSHSIFESAVTFNQNGGKIGRNKQMDWILHDPTKYISNFHAEITFSNNQYYITDKSSNGTAFKTPHKKLTKDIPVPLTENTVIVIGKYEISVKFSNNVFLEKEIHDVQTKTTDDFGIPDQFFTGNDTEKAFDIISQKEKSSDILSLIDKNPVPIHNEILPEIDNIIGDFSTTQEPNIDSGLNVHIETPQAQEYTQAPKEVMPSEMEANKEESQERLFDILATQLGVDTKGMSLSEKEAFVKEIAGIAKATVEYAQTTAQSVNTIQTQLGFNGEITKNILAQGISTSKIFSNLHRTKVPLDTEIKSLFHEVNTHNVALYTAISNLSLHMLTQFSPQKLYISFEQENLLNKKLANKKALAWEAYVERYKYLDTLTHKEDVDMSTLKKEYQSVSNTLNLGHKK